MYSKATMSHLNFLSEEISLIFFLKTLALIAFFTYGFELFNFNFSIDEEYLAEYLNGVPGWIQQGRWAMYVLNRIFFPFTVVPVFPLLFGLFFYIVGIAVFFKATFVRLDISHIIVGGIIITFPSLILVFNFSTLVYGIGFGVFTVALGFSHSVKNSKVDICLTIILYAVSLGIYQSFLFLILAMTCFHFIFNEIQKAHQGEQNQNWMNFLFKHFLLIFISLLSYSLIHKLILYFMNLQVAYVDGFYNPKYLLEHPVAVLNTTKGTIKGWIYKMNNPAFLKTGESFKHFMRFCYILIIIRIARLNMPVIKRIFLFLIYIFTLISPFLLNLMNKGTMPERSLLALPFVIGASILLAYAYNHKIIKFVIATWASFIIFQFGIISVRHQNSSHLALTADRLLGARLLNKIESLQAKYSSKKFEVVGLHSIRSSNLIIKNETIGASFFEWDGGNPSRILAFLKYIGLENLRPVTNSERLTLVEFVSSMPSWPQEGSIVNHEGTIIVKFGDYSEHQKKQLCKGRSKLMICN